MHCLWQNKDFFVNTKMKKQKIPHCRNNPKIPHCRNNSKIPHCLNNSKIPHCRNNSKIPHCRNNSKIKYQNHRKRSNQYPLNTQIQDRSLSWLGTSTSIKSGGVKLGLWTQTSPLSEIRGHVSVFHVRVKCQTSHITDEYDRVWRKIWIFYTIHSNRLNNKMKKKIPHCQNS